MVRPAPPGAPIYYVRYRTDRLEMDVIFSALPNYACVRDLPKQSSVFEGLPPGGGGSIANVVQPCMPLWIRRLVGSHLTA
jgi:hypothetical protein